jgi:hypothetical protein
LILRGLGIRTSRKGYRRKEEADEAGCLAEVEEGIAEDRHWHREEEGTGRPLEGGAGPGVGSVLEEGSPLAGLLEGIPSDPGLAEGTVRIPGQDRGRADRDIQKELVREGSED